MGNNKSQLTKSELEYYKELTYLTEREIQYAFKRFKNLYPRILNKDKFARISVEIIKRMPEFQKGGYSHHSQAGFERWLSDFIGLILRDQRIMDSILDFIKDPQIALSLLQELCSAGILQNNPFADRICEIFSSESDGLWSFEDFLDMVSVFSPATPPEKKAEYAFCIYDFDGDGFLSKEDIAKLITALTAGEILTDEDIKVVIERTMEEADIDKDGMLSPGEFKHVLMKCPDFARSFAIRI